MEVQGTEDKKKLEKGEMASTESQNQKKAEAKLEKSSEDHDNETEQLPVYVEIEGGKVLNGVAPAPEKEHMSNIDLGAATPKENAPTYNETSAMPSFERLELVDSEPVSTQDNTPPTVPPTLPSRQNSMGSASVTSAAPAASSEEKKKSMLPFFDSLMSEKGSQTAATTMEDGRVTITLDSKLARDLAQLIPPPMESHNLPLSSSPVDTTATDWTIPLNVVIQVVGNRADVQPFLALGSELRRSGHRVRVATHNVFESFVTDSGLEFYPVGGDPTVFMADTIKSLGLLYSLKTIGDNEQQLIREAIAVVLNGCWDSCIKPDPITQRPFVADAIIANQTSFAHVHCAQALGIPLQLISSLPWTSTRAFAHPLASPQTSTMELGVANYLTFMMIEFMTWESMRDIINKWRKTLDMEMVDSTLGPYLAQTLKIPITYICSSTILPKPIDWPSYVDICGFIPRELPKYTPPKELEEFLQQGSRPIYITFGNMVINEPEKLTVLVLKAVEATGTRAIIARGPSQLGSAMTSKDVYFVDDLSHEWLFPHVAAIVHYGAADITACGLSNACPMAIIPFQADQPFWGEMVAAAGAGPKPIPFNDLIIENLIEAIQFCLSDKAVSATKDIAAKMKEENGVKAAVASFHRNLPVNNVSCDLLPALPASWSYAKEKKSIKLSRLSVEILLQYGKVTEKSITPFETKPVNTKNRSSDEVTNSLTEGAGTASKIGTAAAAMFLDPLAEYQKAEKSKAGGETQDKGKVASAMAVASAKNMGKFNLGIFKGAVVDVPLAMTEGLRQAPRLYGEKVEDHGAVTGWKSGMAVGGKSFLSGMAGLSDIVTQPYQGAQKEGAKGFFKGLGKGTLGATSKVTAGTLGLLAFPGAGISKSIQTATHDSTRKNIRLARHEEGKYNLQTKEAGGEEIRTVLWLFDEWNNAP